MVTAVCWGYLRPQTGSVNTGQSESVCTHNTADADRCPWMSFTKV